MLIFQGVDILKLGGNAVDAAVTVCLCLGVASPVSSGIGGGAGILYLLVNFLYLFLFKSPNERWKNRVYRFKRNCTSSSV